MRKAALAFLAAMALASAAFAQSLPPLPPNSFVGNTTPFTATGRAVPITTLQALLLYGETPVSNADYSAISTDRTIVYVTLSAAHTVTLLPASSYAPGAKLLIFDRSGNASGTNTIKVAPAGSDTINGANATTNAVTNAFGSATIETDGVSKWTVLPNTTLTLPLAVANGGTGCSAGSGTCLDNITAFSSIGYLRRTGAGTYIFKTITDCQDTGGNHLNYNLSTDTWSCGNTSGGGGGSSTIVAPQGRLTLASQTPVMTTSQSAKSTIFYDCYGGNVVPYYNGTSDQLDTIASCEVSLTMVATATTGQIANGDVFDVWWVHGGASRICIATNGTNASTANGWSADTGGATTTRGTGYSQLDRVTRPYITNKNAITHCYNGATDYGSVSANQATYLGTIYSTAAGQTSFTFGSKATGGSQAAMHALWNMYNRVSVDTVVNENMTGTCTTEAGTQTGCWTYSGGTFRASNNSTGNRISAVVGVAEDTIRVSFTQRFGTNLTAGARGVIGIIRDDPGTGFADYMCSFQTVSNGTIVVASTCTVIGAYSGLVGFHWFQAQEISDGSSQEWFFGNEGNGGSAERYTLAAQMRM